MAGHDVFVSHSSRDAGVAAGLCQALERHGLACWIAPRNISAGATYSASIVEAIEGSGAMLLVLSGRSNASRHVLREVELASGQGVPVVPVRIEAVEPSNDLRYFLSATHWYDAANGPLDDHVANVVAALRKLLERPAGKSRKAATTGATANEVTVGAPSLTNGSPANGPLQRLETPIVEPRPSAGPVKVPAFHFGGVVPPEYFIGREEELERGERAVCSGNNTLVVGELRSGKTSFGKMLIHRIMGRPGNDVLGAYLNVQQWPTLTIQSFLEHTIISLVGEMARQVFGVKFMALSGSDPTRGRDDLRNDDAFASFLEAYRFVRDRTHASGGASSPAPFRTEEFVQVHTELMDIIRSRGWNGCFVFYDEANRLPRDLSVDLLLSHQEALTLAGLTSVYAASPAMVETHDALQEWFVSQIRLGPFCGRDEMRRLLGRYYFGAATRLDDVPALSDALDTLWQLSRGMPFLIQLIAGRSFDLACRRGDSELTERHVVEAHQALVREKPTAFALGAE